MEHSVMATIPVVNSDADVDTIAKHLETEGCVVIERLASERLLGEIESQLEPRLREVNTINTEFSGLKTKRFNGILSQVPAAQALALHPLILASVERMLLPYCARVQLNYDGIMHLMPGETAQPLHRDGNIYPLRHPAPAYIIACMWAQTDFTVENGGTCLIPGSHLWEQEREAERDQVINTVMPRGSVVMYVDGAIHGAGENRSNGPRTGLSLQYNLAWLRQELNMYLTYPPEVAKQFPDALQRLIGYDLAGPYLGFIEEGSPHLALEDGPKPEIRERTTPALDAAIGRVKPIPFG